MWAPAVEPQTGQIKLPDSSRLAEKKEEKVQDFSSSAMGDETKTWNFAPTRSAIIEENVCGHDWARTENGRRNGWT
jgi:hypothetical protein